MSYWVSFTVYCTAGVHHDKTSSNTLDVFNTLMSLFEHAVPKNTRQIHKSCDVTTLRIIVGLS